MTIICVYNYSYYKYISMGFDKKQISFFQYAILTPYLIFLLQLKSMDKHLFSVFVAFRHLSDQSSPKSDVITSMPQFTRDYLSGTSTSVPSALFTLVRTFGSELQLFAVHFSDFIVTARG